LAEPQILAREALDLLIQQVSLVQPFALDGLSSGDPVPRELGVEQAILR
jgi:hypothetical protein